MARLKQPHLRLSRWTLTVRLDLSNFEDHDVVVGYPGFRGICLILSDYTQHGVFAPELRRLAVARSGLPICSFTTNARCRHPDDSTTKKDEGEQGSGPNREHLYDYPRI